jgi:non-specific serine/threonine protein kinase
MNPAARWSHVSSILSRVLDLPEAQRSAFIADAVEQEPTLRTEILALFEELRQGERFLEDPAAAPPHTDAGEGPLGPPEPFEAPRLPPGAALGPYRIETLIGAGGMGEVYRARDARLGRDVAVKVLPEAVFADPGWRSRFEREARAASALNHPNIITLHDIGEADGVLFIVMECVHGRTLRELLAAGPLEPQRMLDIAVQAAEGLAKAHEAGVVHRDVKPENLMVSAEGVVKILDFGLAKQSAEPPSADPSTGTLRSETRSGTVMGTIGYMSPEQATGRAVDFRSDQFSLGSILYEMATGRAAFRRASEAESLSSLLREDPAAIERLNPRVPAPLRRIVGRCLRKEPAERYASTRDLARELRALRHHPGGGTRRAAARAVALVLVALAALGIWRVRATPPPPASGNSATAASIAVLPFQNVSGRAEDEYFADGTTEAIITELARMKGLTVIGRNSTFQYKGRDVDLRRVGEDLGVGYVLEGSVQRAADRLRLHAQLIDLSTGAHRWAERYDREVADVFEVQDDVARDIAAALNVALVRHRAERPRSAPTRNLAAHDAYLRGRYLLAKDHADPRGITMIEQAVAADPAFAAAHSALAVTYAGRFWFRQDRTWEEKAAVHVQKALLFDPDQSDDAYLARGWLAWNLARGFPHEAVIRDLRRALEINPNNADASFLLGLVYLHVGLLGEARQAFGHSVALNPYKEWRPGEKRGATAQKFIAWTYLLEHTYERVLSEYQRTPQTPAMSLPVDLSALLYLGREQEVRPVIEKVLAPLEREAGAEPPAGRETRASAFALRAILHARAGEHERAEKDIAAAVQRGEGQNHFHHTQYFIGSAYALMGRNRQAVEWLERTAADGFPCYPTFERDPHFDGLRGDPAFRAFMQKLKAQWEGYRALR